MPATMVLEKLPVNTRNSAAKPLVAGSPSEPSPAMEKTTVMKGICRARPPSLRQVAFVDIVDGQAGHGEGEAGQQAVADHLEGGAGQAYLVQGEDAEQDVAHVADAAVGDEPFEIGLPQRDGGAVQDADHGHDDEQQGVLAGNIREDAHQCG